MWRLWVIGWYSVQVACDVELWERRVVHLWRETQLQEIYQTKSNLAAVLVMEPEGVDDHVELLILNPRQELRL